MANGNTVTVVGNLTRDPELRYTPSGASNTRFGVAVNRRWMDRNTNEWQEATSFFDVVCWREMAENVSESLAKGSRVVVTGRLEQRSYEDRDGNRRNVVEIIADEAGPRRRRRDGRQSTRRHPRDCDRLRRPPDRAVTRRRRRRWDNRNGDSGWWRPRRRGWGRELPTRPDRWRRPGRRAVLSTEDR